MIDNKKILFKFIQTNKNVDWYSISYDYKLSENFIQKFQNEINWYFISACQELSENFIREFQNKVIWDCISRNQKLSESFIRKFQDKVDWYKISRYQKLSENFIREFRNKVDWVNISIYQKLSKNFKKEFKHKNKWSITKKYYSNLVKYILMLIDLIYLIIYYRKILYGNFKIKSIVILYQHIKNYLKILKNNLNIKINGQ